MCASAPPGPPAPAAALRQRLTQFGGHVRRIEEAPRVRDTPTRRRRAGPRCVPASRTGSGQTCRPFAPTGVENPEAHHVLQKSHGARHADLVGEVRRAANPGGSAGRSTPTSDQVPDEMNAHPAVNGVPATAGRVVRRRLNHADREQVEGVTGIRSHRTQDGTGRFSSGGIKWRGRPSSENSSASQSRSRALQQLCGRRVGRLTRLRRAEKVMTEIGNHQQPGRARAGSPSATWATSWKSVLNRRR